MKLAIYVSADMQGNLTTPIYIGTEEITKLGLYEIDGIKWWILEKGLIPKPAEPEYTKYCTCKNYNKPYRNKTDGILRCIYCHKPLAPQKEIEELDLDLLNFPNERIEREQIIFFKIIVYKINEIIRKLKGAGK